MLVKEPRPQPQVPEAWTKKLFFSQSSQIHYSLIAKADHTSYQQLFLSQQGNSSPGLHRENKSKLHEEDIRMFAWGTSSHFGHLLNHQ